MGKARSCTTRALWRADHGRGRTPPARSSRHRAGRCHGLLHGRAYRQRSSCSTIRRACGAPSLPGSASIMVRGMVGTGPLAKALEAPQHRRRDQRYGAELQSVRRTYRRRPQGACRLHARSAREDHAGRSCPHSCPGPRRDRHGGRDRAAQGAELAALIPGAQLLDIKGRDHMKAVGDAEFQARCARLFNPAALKSRGLVKQEISPRIRREVQRGGCHEQGLRGGEAADQELRPDLGAGAARGGRDRAPTSRRWRASSMPRLERAALEDAVCHTAGPPAPAFGARLRALHKTFREVLPEEPGLGEAFSAPTSWPSPSATRPAAASSSRCSSSRAFMALRDLSLRAQALAVRPQGLCPLPAKPVEPRSAVDIHPAAR